MSLCALLIPQLTRARRRVQNVVCQANLGQWGKIWAIYCQTNKESFSSGIFSDGANWNRACFRHANDY